MAATSGVRLELTGADAALAALGRASEQAARPRGLFKNIGLSLVTSTQRRFDRGVAPSGSPWPPSIRAAARGRRRDKGVAGKTLIDTARLLHSITFEANDGGVAVGTNVIYAAIHQFGGVIRREAHSQVLHFEQSARTGKLLKGFRKAKNATLARKVQVDAYAIKIPARPFLGLDGDDEPEIVRLVEDWLIGPQGAGNAH